MYGGGGRNRTGVQVQFWVSFIVILSALTRSAITWITFAILIITHKFFLKMILPIWIDYTCFLYGAWFITTACFTIAVATRSVTVTHMVTIFTLVLHNFIPLNIFIQSVTRHSFLPGFLSFYLSVVFQDYSTLTLL